MESNNINRSLLVLGEQQPLFGDYNGGNCHVLQLSSACTDRVGALINNASGCRLVDDNESHVRWTIDNSLRRALCKHSCAQIIRISLLSTRFTK